MSIWTRIMNEEFLHVYKWHFSASPYSSSSSFWAQTSRCHLTSMYNTFLIWLCHKRCRMNWLFLKRSRHWYIAIYHVHGLILFESVMLQKKNTTENHRAEVTFALMSLEMFQGQCVQLCSVIQKFQNSIIKPYFQWSINWFSNDNVPHTIEVNNVVVALSINGAIIIMFDRLCGTMLICFVFFFYFS